MTDTPTKPFVTINEITRVCDDCAIDGSHVLVIQGHIDVLLAIAQDVRLQQRQADAAVGLLKKILEGWPPPEGVTVIHLGDESQPDGPIDEGGDSSGFSVGLDKLKKLN